MYQNKNSNNRVGLADIVNKKTNNYWQTRNYEYTENRRLSNTNPIKYFNENKEVNSVFSQEFEILVPQIPPHGFRSWSANVIPTYQHRSKYSPANNCIRISDLTWLNRYGTSVSHESTSRSLLHSRLIIGFVIRLTRRVPLVEQELLTLPDHMSSPPVLVRFVLLDLQFYVYVLQIVVCPFVLFLLSIVLSVHRFTDSDYPFGIFKRFLMQLQSRSFLHS